MRRPSTTLLLTWLITFLTGALVIVGMVWMANTIDELRRSVADKDAQVSDLFDQYTALYAQAEEEGLEPSTVEPNDVAGEVRSVPGPAGEPGSVGAPGPRGPQGETGPAGDIGTPGATGPAGASGGRGPAGQDGSDGTPGAAGAQGEPGPAGPQGPAGPAGASGSPGPAGRGVASLDCQDDGTWLVTYTDQTTSTTPGPCRITLIPTPEETS